MFWQQGAIISAESEDGRRRAAGSHVVLSYVSVCSLSALTKLSCFCINSWDEAVSRNGVSFWHKTLLTEASNTVIEQIVAVTYFSLEISLFWWDRRIFSVSEKYLKEMLSSVVSRAGCCISVEDRMIAFHWKRIRSQ